MGQNNTTVNPQDATDDRVESFQSQLSVREVDKSGDMSRDNPFSRLYVQRDEFSSPFEPDSPILLYPHAPSFEAIQTTLRRHFNYNYKTLIDPNPRRPTSQAIFESLHNELESALHILKIDMRCSTCGDPYIFDRHMSRELNTAVRELQRAIESLRGENWMNEPKLMFIGERFSTIKKVYMKSWRESECVLGGWKQAVPQKLKNMNLSEEDRLNIDLWDGVNVDLPPFGQPGGWVPQRWAKLANEMNHMVY